MSPSSPLSNESLARSNANANADADSQPQPGSLAHEFRQHVRSLKGPTQFVAFWAAVTLPFVHVGLLASGLDQWPTALAFLVLLVVNVVALYVGHGYNRS